MIIRSISEAKGQLSSLVRAVLNGEEVILDRAGVPVVRIVPFKETKAPRTAGTLRIEIAEDFDDEMPEVNELFYGGRAQ